MEHTHFDTITRQPCSIDARKGNHAWVTFAVNGRPRTRKSSDIITKAELEAQKAKAASRTQESLEGQIKYLSGMLSDMAMNRDVWMKQTDLARGKLASAEAACDVQHRTLQWLLDNKLNINHMYDGTPQWVVDVLDVANGRSR